MRVVGPRGGCWWRIVGEGLQKERLLLGTDQIDNAGM
jgi:hypothetical protein